MAYFLSHQLTKNYYSIHYIVFMCVGYGRKISFQLFLFQNVVQTHIKTSICTIALDMYECSLLFLLESSVVECIDWNQQCTIKFLTLCLLFVFECLQGNDIFCYLQYCNEVEGWFMVLTYSYPRKTYLDS